MPLGNPQGYQDPLQVALSNNTLHPSQMGVAPLNQQFLPSPVAKDRFSPPRTGPASKYPPRQPIAGAKGGPMRQPRNIGHPSKGGPMQQPPNMRGPSATPPPGYLRQMSAKGSPMRQPANMGASTTGAVSSPPVYRGGLR